MAGCRTPLRPERSASSPALLRGDDSADADQRRRHCVYSPGMTGSMPRHGGTHQRIGLPGYTGHVAGKVAENLHGGTFRAENEHATQLLPLRHLRRTMSLTNPREVFWNEGDDANRSRGLKAAPTVPGYAGSVPGKLSETVHGMRFAEASESANALRESNPHVHSDGWLRKGNWPSDRMPTYNFNNRFVRTDGQNLWTREQEEEACEANARLGHTFGLKPPKPSHYRPGDRYLHATCRATSTRLDPASVSPAGQPSVSTLLDQHRWRSHHTLSIGNGNQRCAF